MNKTYYYDKKIYAYRVTMIGVISGIILLYATLQLLINPNNWLMIGPFFIGLYAFWETFVSVANPSSVTITDDSVTFSAYGRSHTWYWKDVTKLQVKEFPTAKKLFIRFNDPGYFKGRYWVAALEFNDTNELYNYFLDKEFELHPDTLKGRARQSSIDSKKAKEKEAAEKAERRKRKLEQRAKEAELENKKENSNTGE